MLRDGFEVEAINSGWSLDIEEANDFTPDSHTNGAESQTPVDEDSSQVVGGAVAAFEQTIRDPSLDALQAASAETNGYKLEVDSLDTQHFLATQIEILDKIRNGADSNGMDSSRVIRGRQLSQSRVDEGDGSPTDEGRVNEHIGPVQFNMGGIQVDADDMLQRLRVCQVCPKCCVNL